MFSTEMLAKKLLERTCLTKKPFFIKKDLLFNFIEDLFGILNPHCHPDQIHCVNNLMLKIDRAQLDLYEVLTHVLSPEESKRVAQGFVENLGAISDLLIKDATAIFEGDPAAKSLNEVTICYPGYRAIAVYRFGHFLYLQGVPIIPRMFSEYAHQVTGVDIHPGANIGEHFCIDHGTGVVIGETTVIGHHVKIYQGVTLGALSVEKSHAHLKRHPTIEDNVVIYANATILGGETVVGKDSVIGGGVWLTKSVPPHSVVIHKADVQLNPK